MALIKSWPKKGHLEPVVHEVLRPLRLRREWFKCEPEFGVWVCEQLIAGLRDNAIKGVALYVELERTDGPHPDDHRLNEELFQLGFETFAYRMKAAAEEERLYGGHKWIDKWAR